MNVIFFIESQCGIQAFQKWFGPGWETAWAKGEKFKGQEGRYRMFYAC